MLKCDLCGVPAEAGALFVSDDGYRHCPYCDQVIGTVKELAQGSANSTNIRLVKIAIRLLQVFEDRLVNRLTVQVVEDVKSNEISAERNIQSVDYFPPAPRRGRPKGSLNKKKGTA